MLNDKKLFHQEIFDCNTIILILKSVKKGYQDSSKKLAGKALFKLLLSNLLKVLFFVVVVFLIVLIKRKLK